MFLPLFPLGLVVFPGENLNLHIFEPRYKQLITECSESKAPFGIPVFHDGKLADYGAEMELIAIHTVHPNGEMDILTKGLHVFRLDTFIRDVPNKLYSAGEVTRLDNDATEQAEVRAKLCARFAHLHGLLVTGRDAPDTSADNVSFRIAPEVGLTMEQKILLLSMLRESDRQEALIEHLDTIIPIIEAAEETKKKISANGRFKTLPTVEL